MKSAFLVACVLSIGACSDSTDKALDEMSALADKLCGCPDMACAEKLEAEVDAVKAKHASGDHDRASGAQTQRAVKIALKWDDCMDQVKRRSK